MEAMENGRIMQVGLGNLGQTSEAELQTARANVCGNQERWGPDSSPQEQERGNHSSSSCRHGASHQQFQCSVTALSKRAQGGLVIYSRHTASTVHSRVPVLNQPEHSHHPIPQKVTEIPNSAWGHSHPPLWVTLLL